MIISEPIDLKKIRVEDVCSTCDYDDCGGPTDVCDSDCDCNCTWRD